MKQTAYRKQLTNALKLWQKSGYKAASRERIRERAASRVREVEKQSEKLMQTAWSLHGSIIEWDNPFGDCTKLAAVSLSSRDVCGRTGCHGAQQFSSIRLFTRTRPPKRPCPAEQLQTRQQLLGEVWLSRKISTCERSEAESVRSTQQPRGRRPDYKNSISLPTTVSLRDRLHHPYAFAPAHGAAFHRNYLPSASTPHRHTRSFRWWP